MLLQLEATVRNEYIRGLCLASLLWNKDCDDLPASAFVEEAVEASLSRLSTRAGTDLRAHTVQQFSNMYTAMGPTDNQPVDLKDPNLPRIYPERLLLRVQRLCNAITLNNVPYVSPTATAGVRYRTHGVRPWPTTKHLRLPGDPWQPVDKDYVDKAYDHALKVLVEARATSSSEELLLHALCGSVPELSNEAIARRQQVIDALLGRSSQPAPMDATHFVPSIRCVAAIHQCLFPCFSRC